MEVLDYTNKEFNDLQFNDETLIIMAHQRKIITINDHKELWEIKYILEEIADEINEEEIKLEDNVFEDSLIDGYCKSDIVRMLVDAMEEEAYFLETKGGTDHYETRKLKVINAEELYGGFNSDISIYYGYLNSSDEFIESKWYKVIAEELFNFALNSGKCKSGTIELLTKFSSVLLEEYDAYKNNKPMFKVIVKED
jgi:hypothetical protein